LFVKQAQGTACVLGALFASISGMTDATKAKEEVLAQPEKLADDDRGLIEKLGTGPWQSVLRITSKAGTVRANHYHQHDSHLCFLESGKLRYVERDVLSATDNPETPELGELREYIIEPGQLFYTSPMIAHAMHFLEDSVFYALTPRSGDQDEYENDVVRVVLVEPKETAARTTKK